MAQARAQEGAAQEGAMRQHNLVMQLKEQKEKVKEMQSELEKYQKEE